MHLPCRPPRQVDGAYTATVTVQQRSGSRVSFVTECRCDGTGAVVVRGEALALIRAALQQQQGAQQRQGAQQQRAEQRHQRQQEPGGE